MSGPEDPEVAGRTHAESPIGSDETTDGRMTEARAFAILTEEQLTQKCWMRQDPRMAGDSGGAVERSSAGGGRTYHRLMRLFGRGARARIVGGPPSAIHFPRHPAALLATDAWRPLAQLADQRIRAHRGEHLDVGALIETVATEIDAVLLDEPMPVLRAAWSAWDTEMRRIEGRAPRVADPGDAVQDVSDALAVHAELSALVPSLVVSRLSENVR